MEFQEKIKLILKDKGLSERKFAQSIGLNATVFNRNVLQKYYDIINAFNKTDTIIWKQSNNIWAGDIVYLDVAAPISAILYKCEVLETDIP